MFQTLRAVAVANPCASVALSVGGALGVLFYLASWAGLSIPVYVAPLVAGAVISATLTVDAEGILGVWHRILHGRGS